MNAPQAPTWGQVIAKWEPEFEQTNQYGMVFKSECHFALQRMMANDFLLKTARSNPDSLHNAIINVAAIGISLNPASAHAYLVPREGAVCLDISYLGLVAVARDSGCILVAKPELIYGPRNEYDGDKYDWQGSFFPPVHGARNPNQNTLHPDRVNANDPLENVIGAYCVALIPNSTELAIVEQMSIAEILKIRNTSMAYSKGKDGKKGPWEAWPDRMALKSIVKRAAKSWPQTGQRIRLDKAIAVLNEHEGDINIRNITPEQEDAPAPAFIQPEQILELQHLQQQLGWDDTFLAKKCGVQTINAIEARRVEYLMEAMRKSVGAAQQQIGYQP